MMYVDFTAGNKEYKLRLSTRSVVALEKQLGCNPISIFGTGDRIPTITEMVAILHHSLQQFNHGITLNDAYDVFDAYLSDGHTSTDFIPVILEIYKTSGIISDEKKLTEGTEDEDEDPSVPFLFSNRIYNWLDNALDANISELDFWNMTFAEVNRAIASKARIEKAEAQNRASFDYILAQLITRGCNIAFVGKGELPTFEETYSFLYEKQENVQAKRQQQKDELSALRFQLFAQSYNQRFKEANKQE